MPSDTPLTAHTRRVVIALIFGAVLPLLDTSVVNVAIRPLADLFGVNVTVTQWVITGYALASTVAIILTGFTTRRFGAPAVWKTAIAVFTLSSLLCALAWNIESLIGFRIIQGFAAGLSMPVMQTILITSAGKAQATRAMTAVGLPAVIAPVIGPLFGGVLLQTLGWQSVFLINLPVGVAAFILAVRILSRSTPADTHAKLDLTGFALLAPGLILAVYGLATSGITNSGMGMWACLGIGVILIGGYALWAKHTPRPLIDTVVFTFPTFTSAWLSLTLASIVFYGGLFLIPLYYQTLYNYTPLQAGLLLALLGVGAYVGRTATNKLTAQWGTRATAYLFIVCTLIGTVPFALPISHTTVWLTIEAVSLIIRGAGIGALTMLTMSSLYHQMPSEHIVHVSASSRIATQLGSALGVAICALLLATDNGITHSTFICLSVITSALALTAVRLPRGQVTRL